MRPQKRPRNQCASRSSSTSMMSPRRKLIWVASWAEKSNWAWAKQDRGCGKGRKWLVRPPGGTQLEK